MESKEKGQVLYIEDWAKRQKYKDSSHVIMGFVLILVGIILIGIGVSLAVFGGAKDPTLGLLCLVPIGGFVTFFGFTLFGTEIKTMPLKIYENGFTLTIVPFKEGWGREELFIPWERLNSVTLESFALYNVAIRKIKLIYDGNKEQELTYDNMSDPFEVIKVLKSRVPGKMDDNFKIYIGNDEERKIIKKPIPITPEKYKCFLPLLMAIFMLVLLGSFMPGITFTKKSIFGGIILLSFIIPVVALMFWMSFSLAEHTQKELIHYDAKATDRGIEIPQTFYGRIIKKVRKFLPYDEVKIVRMKLDTLFYAHEAEIETVDGEKYWVPFSIYEKVSQKAEFTLMDYDYINKSPGHSRGPLVTWNKPGIICLILLVVSISLIGPMFPGNFTLIFEQTQYLCIGLVFLILLPLYLVVHRLIAQRSKISTGISANDKGIFLPNASDDRFRYIPKNDFISARVDKDLLGFYCELNCAKGTIKLSRSVAEKLLYAGYPVENLRRK